ncbi:MAG: energy transducer TonB [Prevotella sp.]|nr:energy transducer TonB [Prevotella sp.]
MKKILLFLLFSTVSLGIQAQASDDYVYGKGTDTEELKNIQMPQYPGGTKGLVKFLSQTLKYPKKAQALKAEGRVLMHFVLKSDATITDIYASDCVITSINLKKLNNLSAEEQQSIREELAKMFAKEGYRVVSKMKNWQPGYRIDETTGEKTPVNVFYTLPITFRFP